MEIDNLRAVYLPDIDDSITPIYTIVKNRDGLHWAPDTSDLSYRFDRTCTGFDLPFIDDEWMIMQTAMELDINDKEIFEMDVVEVTGYHQTHFIVVRSGHSFVLFDGHSGILNDPMGEVWKSCKVVCPIWDASNLEQFAPNYKDISKKCIKF